MKTIAYNLSVKSWARITGFFYLLIIAGGLFSGMLVRETLIEPLDAMATLNNIMANEHLFRLGFLGDLVMVLSDVVISVLFYFLLKNVNKGIAVMATVFRLMQSAILGANLINLFKPMLMIQNYPGLSDTQTASLAHEILIQMQVFEYGYLISGVFFALNCLLMGILLYKSVHFPNMIGLMMLVAGFGYLFNCLANFIAPSLIETSEMVMLVTAVVAELTFCLYLLIKGVSSN